MAISLKHAFQSAKADGGDNTVVQPSNWNADHVLTCASGVVLGRLTAGNGSVEELTSAQAAAALNVVKKTGDTMTGSLVLPGNPTAALEAAPKQYVDTFTPASRLVSTGAGLTGGGNLASDRTLTIANAGVTPAMLSQPFTAKTALTVTGANADFTALPSWVQRIDIALAQVSLAAGSVYPLIRLGTVTGFVTTGYSSMSTYIGQASYSYLGSTAGFLIFTGGIAGANIVTGNATLLNITGNTWVMSFTGFCDINGFVLTISAAGRIALSGKLTQLRLTNDGATVFNGGTVNIFYQ